MKACRLSEVSVLLPAVLLCAGDLRSGGIGRLCQRQPECELGSDAFQALHLDIAVVGADDPANQRQPESGALAAVGAGGICLVKALPDMREMFLRDSDSIVFD